MLDESKLDHTDSARLDRLRELVEDGVLTSVEPKAGRRCLEFETVFVFFGRGTARHTWTGEQADAFLWGVNACKSSHEAAQ